MYLRIIVIAVMTLMCAQQQVMAQDRLMVVLGHMNLDMKLRSIQTRSFNADSNLSSFAQSLADAGLLFCSMDSRSILLKVIESKTNRDAIRYFLAGGGVMWFDDRYGYGNKQIA